MFIGRIKTPWTDRHTCPRSGSVFGEICEITLQDDYAPGLQSIDTCSHLIVLYWMHEARRDLIVQAPAFDSATHGCFALRTPIRPNPVSLSVVELIEREGSVLKVRGLDCLDGTPLIDIKPYFAKNDSRSGCACRLARAPHPSGPALSRTLKNEYSGKRRGGWLRPSSGTKRVPAA